MQKPQRDRRADRHRATKASIVEAAWQLSDERGLAGWSLRDVADIVGMRAPSLYVYFDSKGELYDAMFADGYRALLEQIAATPTDPDPAAALHRAARVFVDFGVAQPARYHLLFLRTIPGFVPSTESYQLAQESLAALRTLLVAAGAGEESAVDLFTALMSGLATQQVSNDPGGDRWSRLVDQAVDMFLRSLESRGTGPRERTRAPGPSARRPRRGEKG